MTVSFDSSGISYKGSTETSIHNLVNTTSCTLYAPLKSSLILSKGTGDPTWSRATKAWGFNELGYLEELDSGCAFFGGARLVYNRLDTKSEDFSNAAWTKTVLTVSGTNTLVCNNSTATQRISHATAKSLVTGQRIRFGVRAKKLVDGVSFIQLAGNTGGYGSGQFCNFSLNDGSFNATGCTATSTLVGGTTDTYDFTVNMAALTTGVQDYTSIALSNSLSDTRLQAFVGDGIKSFELLRAWSVDVTNYDVSYVPEYVSVGVPLNTVRTTSEDFSNAAWVKSNCTVTGTNVLVCSNSTADNSVNQATDVSVPTTAGQYFRYSIRAKSISGGVSFVQIGGSSTSFGATAFCTFSLVDGTYSAQAGVTANVAQISSDTYEFSIRLLCTVTTPSSDVFYVSMQNGLSDTRKQSFVGDGVKSFQLLRAWSVNVTGYNASYVPPYYAVGVGTNVYFGAGIDGAKYYETDWQGAPIAAANLLGFRREASAINNLLHSRDLSNAAWSTKTNITAAKTATGLDGIANTATTLTATAADAIILQPITLASAARCASAYVKRRTGSGTISFTQDGGSTWTDITSLINGSTWSRVQITSTPPDPSVGFKISTSGDAIDVDCVQNEAGEKATSPIVTTTSTVTRNTDSLTYQTAGNIDLAVGTMFCELFSPAMSAFPPVFLIGTGSCSLITDEPTSWRFNDSTTTTTIASGLSSIKTGTRKRSAAWGGVTKAVCGDGVAPTSGAFDGSFGTGVTIDIGNTLNGYIRNVAIYNYQMTDAELQAITS